MTLIQLLTGILVLVTAVRMIKFMRAPRAGSRYHDMVLLFLWAVIPGFYVLTK